MQTALGETWSQDYKNGWFSVFGIIGAAAQQVNTPSSSRSEPEGLVACEQSEAQRQALKALTSARWQHTMAKKVSEIGRPFRHVHLTGQGDLAEA